MNTKELDVVEDAILQAYQTNKKSKRRVQIKTDQFNGLTMLEVFVGNVKTGDVKHRVRFFRNNVEVFSYWMAQEDRNPIIAKMLFEGYTQKRISEMLGLSAGTINKDVRYMREHTVMLDGYQFRKPAAAPVKNSRWNTKSKAKQPSVSVH
jgi:DNA-binding NarL/FixJ family response regulator